MLAAGTTLGPYRILAPIDAGGQGEVYRARDTRLGRDVAIKVIPSELARDPERIKRFEQEARAAGALSHPNVCGIHDVGTHEGAPYVVEELLEGESLRARLEQGPLPWRKAAEYIAQVAQGLAAAHAKGIVHRDLKPGNLFVTRDGRVRVLDFGLAKLTRPEVVGGSGDGAPSLASTESGALLGTPGYMAPEQVRGEPADHRSDLFALGAILYEMVSGKRAFPGASFVECGHAVLNHEPPPLADSGQEAPPALEGMVRHCLEKEPGQRFQSASDLAFALQSLSGASATAALAGTPAPRWTMRRAAWIAAGVLLTAVAVAGLVVGIRSRQGLARGPTRVSITIPDDLRITPRGQWQSNAAFSPDGRTIAIRAHPRVSAGHAPPAERLYVRSRDAFDFTALSGTEGVTRFAFSPDSRWIAFAAPRSAESTRLRIAKVPVDGSSPPVTVADVQEWDPSLTWLHGGDILVANIQMTSSVLRIPSSGGIPRPVDLVGRSVASILDQWVLLRPLPGDRAVLVDLQSAGSGAVDHVGALDLRSGRVTTLIEGGGNATLAPSGHLVFARKDALLAVPFDARGLKVTGGPVSLMSGLRFESGWHAWFGLSSTGTLAYAPGAGTAEERRLALLDASGHLEPWPEDPHKFLYGPSVSRDGRRVAILVLNDDGRNDIFLADREHPGQGRRISLAGADHFYPRVSPDGGTIAYHLVSGAGEDAIYTAPFDGSGSPRRVYGQDSLRYVTPDAWSPDGLALLVTIASDLRSPSPRMSVGLLPLSGRTDEPVALRPLIENPANTYSPECSPDGRWIAYGSDVSGKDEVYVAAYHRDGRIGSSTRVPRSVGTTFKWSPDARRLFYVAPPARLMSAAIGSDPSLSMASPIQFGNLDSLGVAGHRFYHFAPMRDGRVLVVLKGPGEGEIKRFDLVLDFFDELRRKTSRK